MKGESSVHSPASGLTDGFGVGGGSTPGKPSVHPDFDMSGKGDGGMGNGTGVADGPTIGGVGATSGPVEFAQLATTGPESYDTGGDPMVGGIGTPPKP